MYTIRVTDAHDPEDRLVYIESFDAPAYAIRPKGFGEHG